MVIDDQRILADPWVTVPTVMSYFSFSRDISDSTELSHSLFSSCSRMFCDPLHHVAVLNSLECSVGESNHQAVLTAL